MEQIHEIVLSKHEATGSTGLWSLREGQHIRGGFCLRHPSFLPRGKFWTMTQEGEVQWDSQPCCEWRWKFGKAEMAGSHRTYFWSNGVKELQKSTKESPWVLISTGPCFIAWNSTKSGKQWIVDCKMDNFQYLHRAGRCLNTDNKNDESSAVTWAFSGTSEGSHLNIQAELSL